MNLPNKLTVARCILSPIFLLTMVLDFPFHYGVALLLFILSSLTDMFDGRIARSRNLITNLGKFLDPLADKVLTTAAFVGFLILPEMTASPWMKQSLCWALMLTMAREFMVTSARYMAAKDGVVIAASMAGKLKTVMQMVAIIYTLAALQAIQWLEPLVPGSGFWLTVAAHILIWVAVVLTVISGLQYVWGCKQYFTEK